MNTILILLPILAWLLCAFKVWKGKKRYKFIYAVGLIALPVMFVVEVLIK